MKLYLAGPMRGIPNSNLPAFFAAEKKLKKKGHVVYNPARWNIELFGKKFYNRKGYISIKDLRKVLAGEIVWLILHARGIVLLPGWKKSAGAKAELAIAKCLGLKVIKLKGKK